MRKLKRVSSRLSAKAERAAWTAAVTGEQVIAPSKYLNERTGKFASKKEAEVATNLCALARAGIITDLEMQVPIVLVPGRDGIHAISYIADFQYRDLDGVKHVVDAKGGKFRTDVYKLKRRLAYLLHGIEIEEA